MRVRITAVMAIVFIVGSGSVSGGRDRSVLDYQSWREAVIERGLDPDEVVYPFASSEEMIVWSEAVIDASVGSDPAAKLAALQQAIFGDTADGFSYDEGQTVTAQEAFAIRRGNCLSFTSLFIALSRSAGIPTVLMETPRVPTVNRDDELVVVSQHVVAAYRSAGQVFVYDFAQRSESARSTGRVIDDLHASAMYHANRGGEALRSDLEAEARRNLEIATILAPEWPVGWVNLGVTLARLDDVNGAFAAYLRALAIDPGNASALNNLSYLYTSLGREEEAKIALVAAAERTANPFTLIALADAELAAGERRQAKQYLKRARWAGPSEPEVYEAFARFAERNGQPDRAERYRRKAALLREDENDDR